MGRPRNPEPSELDIKANIRTRDGHKCQDCGMTVEEHQEKYNETLHVHRLLPGMAYQEQFCVTLCIPCHGKKPRHLSDAIDSDCPDTKVVIFNMYDSHDRAIWDRLLEMSDETDMGASGLLFRILDQTITDRPPDYVIKPPPSSPGIIVAAGPIR